MNHWLELSIEYANQRSYLDDLFQVYPIIPEGVREVFVSTLTSNDALSIPKQED